MSFKRFTHHSAHIIKNKPFDLYWSKRAEDELQKRNSPLLVEMELKFACMVRMRVLFHDFIEHRNSITINDTLSVLYRPVAGKSCDLGDVVEPHKTGELNTGPMANRFPKRLEIDFVRGQWQGQYA